MPSNRDNDTAIWDYSVALGHCWLLVWSRLPVMWTFSRKVKILSNHSRSLVTSANSGIWVFTSCSASAVPFLLKGLKAQQIGKWIERRDSDLTRNNLSCCLLGSLPWIPKIPMVTALCSELPGSLDEALEMCFSDPPLQGGRCRRIEMFCTSYWWWSFAECSSGA